MDCYEIWCDLRDSHADLQFAAAVHDYMTLLQSRQLISKYRLTRRKLGFGPQGMGEFHVTIETDNLSQLEEAFQVAAARAGEVENYHAKVYGAVKNLTFALYRDFPDPVRIKLEQGEA